jgi:hypothetical protein
MDILYWGMDGSTVFEGDTPTTARSTQTHEFVRLCASPCVHAYMLHMMQDGAIECSIPRMRSRCLLQYNKR